MAEPLHIIFEPRKEWIKRKNKVDSIKFIFFLIFVGFFLVVMFSIGEEVKPDLPKPFTVQANTSIVGSWETLINGNTFELIIFTDDGRACFTSSKINTREFTYKIINFTTIELVRVNYDGEYTEDRPRVQYMTFAVTTDKSRLMLPSYTGKTLWHPSTDKLLAGNCPASFLK